MKILIVKTSSLGDVVHTFPAINYLRARFPDATIDWVAEKRECDLLAIYPDVSRVICFDWKQWWNKCRFDAPSRKKFADFVRELRAEKYDLLFDLHGNTKSAIPTALARAKIKVGFGFKSAPEWPNCLFTNKRYNFPEGLNVRKNYLQLVASLFGEEPELVIKKEALKVTADERSRVDGLLEKCKGPVALISTGSQRIAKNLEIKTLAAFLQEVGSARGYQWLFIHGSEEEGDNARILHEHFPENSLIAPKLSVGELSFLMSRSEILFGMDSFPLHLAEISGCKTYGFFGPTVGEVYAPPIVAAHHNFFQSECPYGMKFVVRCPKERSCKDVACMRLKANAPLAKAMAAHFLANFTRDIT